MMDPGINGGDLGGFDKSAFCKFNNSTFVWVSEAFSFSTNFSTKC